MSVWPFNHLVVFDGAIGTELYQRGFYINRPFEELNLSAARDVAAVHESYVEAGAQVLTTNTFAATRPQLRNFDIAERQEEIVVAALEHACGAAKKKKGVSVAFSMGPLGDLLEPLGSVGLEEARREFAHLASIANGHGGFHLYALETFSNINELTAAIDGIRSVDPERPILASIHVKSIQDQFLKDFVSQVALREDVQAIGLNCSEGPSDLFSTLKKLQGQTTKPIVVQPNAGLPRQINGRYFYMTSPDYFAKYAKRYFEAGASGVGGCCGTGPEHIRAILKSVQMMSARHNQTPAVLAKTLVNVEVQPRRSLVERTESRVGRAFSQGKKVVSIEILPPRGTDVEKFYKQLDAIEEAGVEFVNIPDGARASTRIGSLHMASLIAHRSKNISVIPHFTTRDRNLIALQSDLLGAYVNGVSDILLVTGDPPKLGNNRDATGVYDIDSIGLTYLADCLNRGVSPTGDSMGKGTSFGIGVASNPTAINLEVERQRWIYKVESGADYAVTQPIFDPESFLRWKDQIGSHYRPHVVGIWPLISLRNAEFMANEIPGVNVPAWVLEEMAKAGEDPAEAQKRGIAIARKVIEVLSKECEGFAISAPLGKVPIALEVLK